MIRLKYFCFRWQCYSHKCKQFPWQGNTCLSLETGKCQVQKSVPEGWGGSCWLQPEGRNGSGHQLPKGFPKNTKFLWVFPSAPGELSLKADTSRSLQPAREPLGFFTCFEGFFFFFSLDLPLSLQKSRRNKDIEIKVYPALQPSTVPCGKSLGQ